LILFDLAPPKFLVALNLLPILMTFVALMAMCCVPVTTFVMKFLHTPIKTNLDQAFFLNPPIHCQLQLVCYLDLPECPPPIQIDWHIVKFAGSYGGYKEIAYVSTFC